MNIVGKILVFFNLLFALVTGGFLVIDFATRTNWKIYADALKRQLEVAHINNGNLAKTAGLLDNEVKKARAERDDAVAKHADDIKLWNIEKDGLNLQLENEKARTKDNDLTVQKALSDNERLKEEVKTLADTVQKRDKTILAKEEENKKLQVESVANKDLAKRTLDRNEYLLNKIIELEKALAKQDAGVGGTSVANLIKNGNDPNPPPVFLQGVVEKVDPKDRTLAVLTLGSDNGLGKNHTLEVYRLNPRPEYVGMIRIVDVYHNKSVGKLVRVAGATTRPLQEGDQVASHLNNK